jgi:hypothetical protein
VKLAEVASRIDGHIKRIHVESKMQRPWYEPGAYSSGSRVFIVYVRYQGPVSITKAQALTYLAWLDAGGRGRHYAHCGAVSI